MLGERSVRAVVLSGEGKAFCAGLDWGAMLAAGPEVRARLLERDRSRSPANLAQRCCWIWSELPMPVIAAVQGAAFGAGLQLALACDFRIVAPDAQLSVMEIRYGLIPDMTATQTLLRLARPDVARELSTPAGPSTAPRLSAWAWPRGSPPIRSPRRRSWPERSPPSRRTRSAQPSSSPPARPG
jgi:enoyl-CoA hydratase/carnithine racemase